MSQSRAGVYTACFTRAAPSQVSSSGGRLPATTCWEENLTTSAHRLEPGARSRRLAQNKDKAHWQVGVCLFVFCCCCLFKKKHKSKKSTGKGTRSPKLFQRQLVNFFSHLPGVPGLDPGVWHHKPINPVPTSPKVSPHKINGLQTLNGWLQPIKQPAEWLHGDSYSSPPTDFHYSSAMFIEWKVSSAVRLGTMLIYTQKHLAELFRTYFAAGGLGQWEAW